MRLAVVRHFVGVLDIGEVVLDELVADVVGVRFAVVAAAVLAEEREVDAARHVRGGHERADEPDDRGTAS